MEKIACKSSISSSEWNVTPNFALRDKCIEFLVELTGTRRDKVKCLWYKNVGQELVEIKWNVFDIRMSIDFRLKLEKSFYSHSFFQNIYLSIIGSIRNGKSFTFYLKIFTHYDTFAHMVDLIHYNMTSRNCYLTP